MSEPRRQPTEISPGAVRLAWLPAPALLGAIVVARVAAPTAAWESRELMLVLGFLFTTVVALGTLYVVARRFLASGSLGLLLVEAAVLLWSLSSTVGDLVSHGDANANVTIFNTGILFSGMCHLAGAILTLRPPARPLRARIRWLIVTSALALLALGWVSRAAVQGSLPLFFVPGVGGTLVRHGVLGTAIAAFALSAAMLSGSPRTAHLPFVAWYAPALVLLAVGLFGVMLQTALGTAVNWLGRAAQWTGGVYLLLGAVAALRESGRSLFPAPDVARPPLYREGVAVVVVLAAAVVRLVFLQPLGVRAPFVVFYPALVLAALYGGWRTGLLATLLSAALVDYFWIEPVGRFTWGDSADRLAMAVFLLAGGLSSVIAESMRRAQGRARELETRARIALARQEDLDALRTSEERFRSVLEQSVDCLYRYDLQAGRYEYISPAAQRLFGYTVAELVAHGSVGALERTHPDDAPRVRAALTRVEEEGEAEVEYRQRNRAGEYRWISNRMSVVQGPDGRPRYRDGTIRDVTERRQAEQALREADRRKDEFLGVLSHELRNPLAPIQNSLAILARAPAGGEQARRAAAVADRQVRHLTRLVDDLLDVTRITRGKIRLQRARLDLVELVRRAVEDHRGTLGDRRLTVTLPDERVWVNGDPTRLSQAIGNLLQNAAKFTREAGSIRVSLAHDGARATLAIEDDGVGIDAETFQRLFEPFAQADRSLDRSRGGLGLGLALVKGMVELHGGRVTAGSDGPGRGARFTIELPLDGGEVAPSAPAPARAPLGEARRILVIEDNRDAADSLAEVLALGGHHVEVAYDGPAGLAKARARPPEIVFCDIGLPAGMDGYAVARALRSDPGTAPAYLVALTGYAQPEDQRRARGEGFDLHLPKPPDLSVLERVLAEAPSAPPARSGAPAAPPQ
jgi:PAS domain S-box-containing protein